MTIIAFTGWGAVLILALLLIAEIRDHGRTAHKLTKRADDAETAIDYWTECVAVEAKANRAIGKVAAERYARIIDLERRLAVAERKPARDAKGHFVGRQA